MKKTIEKILLTVVAVIALSLVTVTPAIAAGGDDDTDPYNHPPEPTSLVGLEDTVAIASMGTFTGGLVLIAYGSKLKELLNT